SRGRSASEVAGFDPSPPGWMEFSGRARQDVEPEASKDGFTASAELHPARRRLTLYQPRIPPFASLR
ncbi:MAG: hypothetical protein OXE80_10475, partial [Gammaproteobacteria bacterium]|nr:hypothetical protein [Gammaproteobacteria bacterium]